MRVFSRGLGLWIAITREELRRGGALLEVSLERDGGTPWRRIFLVNSRSGDERAVLIGQLREFFGLLDKINDVEHTKAVLELLDLLDANRIKVTL